MVKTRKADRKSQNINELQHFMHPAFKPRFNRKQKPKIIL